MNISHVSTVYFSPTETSAKGAYAIAQVFGEPEKIDLTRFDAVPDKIEFGEDELVVFGAPVYGGRVYKGAIERFKKIKGNHTPCIVTVTYGNRDFDDALLELAETVEALGFTPIAAAALIGQHTYGDIQKGRPNKDDLEEDQKFAQKVLEKLKKEDFSMPDIPGQHPYKDGGNGGSFYPRTTKACTSCGLCATECPEGAIVPENGYQVNTDKCIACFRCIKVCPVGAKNMDVPEYQEFAKMFTEKLKERKENIYF